MTKVLIIDDQDWLVNIYSRLLDGEDIKILATEDINSVDEDIASFKPDPVLINLNLKDGANAVDVSRSIRMKYPNLPILIVPPWETRLYNVRYFKAPAYL